MKISTGLWDQWLCAAVTDHVSAESELSGMVVAMERRIVGNRVRCGTSRIWPFRRIRRIWTATSWARELPLGELFWVQREKVRLDLSLDLYQRICAKPETQDFIRWAWARGVFGVAGGIFNPRRGYYCALRLRDPLVASGIKALLTGNHIASSQRVKDGVYELTIRDLQHIVRFCHYMDMTDQAQSLEDKAMIRSIRDHANKQANCDDANIRRSVESARHQAQIAQFLQGLGEDLPEGLRPLVTLRLSHPSATLQELGNLLRPRVSKSTVKYRWKKLQALAEAAGFRPESALN